LRIIGNYFIINTGPTNFIILLLYLKEVFFMLEVSELAITKLKEYIAQNNIDSAIRVSLMQGG